MVCEPMRFLGLEGVEVDKPHAVFFFSPNNRVIFKTLQ